MKVEIKHKIDKKNKLNQCEIGDIMIAQSITKGKGAQIYPEKAILLCSDGCLVNLSNPKQIWRFTEIKDLSEFPVKFLQKEESVILTIEYE